jgi:hypothetical protein
MLILSTVPVVVPTVTTSPTRTGLSKSRIRPETKFATISWSPNPTPSETAASAQPMLEKLRWRLRMAAA